MMIRNSHPLLPSVSRSIGHWRYFSAAFAVLAVALAGSALAAEPGASTGRIAPPSAAGSVHFDESDAPPIDDFDPGFSFDGSGAGFGQFGGFGASGGAKFEVLATYQTNREGTVARVTVTGMLLGDAYTYSLTQKSGPIATRIELQLPEGMEQLDAWQSNPPPKIISEASYSSPIEKHTGEVAWSALFSIPPGTDVKSLAIEGKVIAQICTSANCLPPTPYAFAAVYDGEADDIQAPDPWVKGEIRPKNGFHAKVRGYLEPAVVAPGQKVKLVLTAMPDEKWHVYGYEPKQTATGYSPTLIALSQHPSWSVTGPTADPAPKEKSETLYDEQGKEYEATLAYHPSKVNWTLEWQVPDDAAPGKHEIAGILGLGVCSDTACDVPVGIEFATEFEVAAAGKPGRAIVSFRQTKYNDAVTATEVGIDYGAATPQSQSAPLTAMSLLTNVLLGLAGGLILNLMPCVLPVIGLKILSFVEQGGHSRARALWLNVCYSAGLMSVFILLATLIAVLNLGWGEQFNNPIFMIGMIGLVFVMALSFLGVWEIPIPGFATSKTATELATQEGASGAFFKGVLATFLGTACSGPLLGPVIGSTLGKHPAVVYLVICSIGVGMALPYLVIGAFPALIRWLPKPGAWMETFKELMAFLLLGAVVFLISTLSPQYIIPTLTLIVGLWFACWWIGKLPITAERWPTIKRYASAGAAAAAIGFIGFYGPLDLAVDVAKGNVVARLRGEPAPVLPWRPYSEEALAQAKRENRLVIVDFTAEWCVNCKLNLKNALNTEQVLKFVEEHNAVPLLADWSDNSSEVGAAIKGHGFSSIPLLVIYSPDSNEPMRIPDLVTESQVLEALERAAGAAAKANKNQVAEEESDIRKRGKPVSVLPWRAHSKEALAQARREDRIIMVYFDADWDMNGKLNLKNALNTAEVLKFVEEHNVVALVADWTEGNREVSDAIKSHGFGSIPLLVIYSPDSDEPVRIPDLLTESQVLDALQSAVGGAANAKEKQVASREE